MADYLIFLSYASFDGDKYLGKFYEEFAREMDGLTGGLQQEKVRAFDFKKNIRAGDNWTVELWEALQLCDVFVLLLSPKYLSSEWCGKECQIFLNRLQGLFQGKSGKQPPVMIPILWNALDFAGPLPTVLAELQPSYVELPEKFVSKGLFHLKRVGRATYFDFLNSFAKRVVSVAKANPLPKGSTTPFISIKQIRSAFEQGMDAAKLGPAYVHFVLAAAPNEELDALGANTMGVSPSQGAKGWMPFRGSNKTAEELVRAVAETDKIDFVISLMDVNFLNAMKQAQENHNRVVVLVDPWMLKLPGYQAALKQFDVLNLSCAIVAIASGAETASSHIVEDLWKEVRATFPRIQQSNAFVGMVSAPEDVAREIRRAVASVHGQMMVTTQGQRKAQGTEEVAYPQVAGPGDAGGANV